MRYPVDDEFAIALANTLYRGVLEQGQDLTRALQLALPETIPGQSPLCVATPVLFGRRAADLTLDVPVTPWDKLDVPTVGGLTGFDPQPKHFVGRVGVMAKAGAALAPRSGRTGVLFHGMSGAGKSACAIELSYQYEDLKRFTGFVWYQAPPEGSEVADSLAVFASKFETQLSNESFEAPFSLVALVAADDMKFNDFLPRLRDFLTKRSVLLVLDNLETLLRPDGGWIDPRWGKVVATLLAHSGDSRVVLTSRVVPALAPPPGPPAAGDFAARLLKLPIHALGLDEAVVLARQLPNLGTLLKGRGGSDDDTREVDRQLVVRTLNLVQGHPKLIELAEAQAADTQGLADHLERAEGAWAAEGVGTGELASFFAAGESHLRADQFLRRPSRLDRLGRRHAAGGRSHAVPGPLLLRGRGPGEPGHQANLAEHLEAPGPAGRPARPGRVPRAPGAGGPGRRAAGRSHRRRHRGTDGPSLRDPSGRGRGRPRRGRRGHPGGGGCRAGGLLESGV